ncbi:hypothetical protein LX16_3777 [Stackebrandtia albiflava]|uniref:DUF3618 domain-containing protein n=1 Tax=Stackebrandtia albiflava TaxID=406432 RepID=A0A562V561_9ACTN|nr:hypothetical protein [Stackebrandtia albiflava]TWJ13010.1 hypothetical protein LX16_3777 [Stackebrandtia albiflava]
MSRTLSEARTSEGHRARDADTGTESSSTGKDAGRKVADQAREVAGETAAQTRHVGAEMRDSVTGEAHRQSDRLAEGIRHMADEFDDMVANREESPARTIVSKVAAAGRRLADDLSEKGPEGVLDEVQDFARRKPGAFVLAAAASGFVVGRLGKAVVKAGAKDMASDGGAETSESAATGSETTRTAGAETTGTAGTGGTATVSTGVSGARTGSAGTTTGSGSAGATDTPSRGGPIPVVERPVTDPDLSPPSGPPPVHDWNRKEPT